MLGGSDNPSARSWLKLRGLLAERYNDIIVVSIAQNRDVDASFSADTGMAEVIVIARRLARQERPPPFSPFRKSVRTGPASKLEAQETAKAIKRVIAEVARPGDYSIVKIGDGQIGFVHLERVTSSDKWTTVRVANPELVKAAKGLAGGRLRLPQSKDAVTIPMTRMGRIGRVGPVDRDIASGPRQPDRGPFTKHDGADSGTEWPFLWNRNSKNQQSMEVSPDSHGIIKAGGDEGAWEIWGRASHLHISKEFRLNSSPTCAAFTKRVFVGRHFLAQLPNEDARNRKGRLCLAQWYARSDKFVDEQ